MQIKKATVAQLPEIVALKLLMYQDAELLYLLTDDFVDRVLEDYRILYRSKKAIHFVAVDNKRIIFIAGGFIKADLPYKYYKWPFYGFLSDVYTVPSARRIGLATQLSQQVLEWLKSKGVCQVRLIATPSGRPLYERLGFTATDEMMLEIKDDDPCM
ncbi:MAG: GNAT family N-acetyltransferase [Candidatus Nitrosoglobus sp.]